MLEAWLFLAIFLIVVGGASFAAWHWFGKQADKAAEKPAPKPVVVSGEKTKRDDLPVYLTGLGTVTAFNTVTVHSRVDGELIKVGFAEGQLVKKDDLLAEIDPRPFQVQLEQAQGQLARDQASLNNAKLDLARYTEAREAIPQQQIDTAAATVAQFEGAVKVDQAQIDAAKLQLVYCTITAPISGRVGLRLVDAGNIVHAADVSGLLVITQVQPISVQFSLPQDNLPSVLKAMAQSSEAAMPPSEAYSRDLKQHLATGRLMALDNQIDPLTGTFRAKAEFQNEDNALYPNQFVNIRLLVDTERGAILAPAPAVQRGPQGAFCYVVKEDMTVEVQPVKVGISERNWIVIREGLDEGEIVVTEGADKLRAGTRVELSQGGKRSKAQDGSSGSGPAPTSDGTASSGASSGAAPAAAPSGSEKRSKGSKGK